MEMTYKRAGAIRSLLQSWCELSTAPEQEPEMLSGLPLNIAGEHFALDAEEARDLLVLRTRLRLRRWRETLERLRELGVDISEEGE